MIKAGIIWFVLMAVSTGAFGAVRNAEDEEGGGNFVSNVFAWLVVFFLALTFVCLGWAAVDAMKVALG